MGRRTELPDELGGEFSAALARRHGVTRSRLRGRDLRARFFGVRIAADISFEVDAEDPYQRQRLRRIARLRAAGWIVIEVTAPLLRRPEELARRVASTLRRTR